MHTASDFHEALYIYALDAERFDIACKLFDSGFSARPNLAHRADLTSCGQRIYDDLGRLFALADEPKHEITVIRRRAACQPLANSNVVPLKWPLAGSTAKKPAKAGQKT